MSDYENRTPTTRGSSGGGRALYWALGILAVLVLIILLFAGGDPGPADGLEDAAPPAPSALPETGLPDAAAPEQPPATAQ
ncbi:hypothetical protein [Dinoroseobacter shibae]|jgi:hypothetical protein|nr:hypothetical protein [Dinoroseobacter shibae]URF47748.1 hypothetical protein M8008_05535 [Dinoroseobacter shibae]URF52058.1 hypothetical protein M8007_05535 [Dinoroseobacter shibae]